MQKYELLYIVDIDLAEEKRKAIVEKLKKLVVDQKATNVEVSEWGKKKLAYPINFKGEGYYVLMSFIANTSVPAELIKQMNLIETIVRHTIVAKEA